MRTFKNVAAFAALVVSAGALAACAEPAGIVTPPQTHAASISNVCPEAGCTDVTGANISHFTGSGCTGTESYYTAYNYYDGVRRSWNGTGTAGTTLRTVTNRSYKDSSGNCYDAWPTGNTLSDFVTIYRTPCPESGCDAVTEAYISHFTGPGCTGTESYYTAYGNFDGVRRSWDGKGTVGTTLRTVTNRSYKISSCYDAWPDGNTLSNFVTVYR